MADYELNDHDRAEIVKRFFARYGYILVAALILFAVALGINSFWQNHQQVKAEAASNAYQALLTSVQNGAKPEVITAAANELINNYSGTVYASLAQLNLASLSVAQNNLGNAESLLRSALKENSHNDLKPVISLRLARVLLAENKADDVIDLLSSAPKGYVPAYGLLKGDAFVQLKKMNDAKLSYQTALAAAGNNPLISQLLTERLNNLSLS